MPSLYKKNIEQAQPVTRCQQASFAHRARILKNHLDEPTSKLSTGMIYRCLDLLPTSDTVVCKGMTLKGLQSQHFNAAEAANAQRKVEEMEKEQVEPIRKSCHWVEDVMGEQKPSWLVIYAGEREYEGQTKRDGFKVSTYL